MLQVDDDDKTVSAEGGQLVRACAVGDLPPGQVLKVPANPPIALFNVGGDFYATADWCTHDKASLADEGYIDGDRVECGWHGATFCIKTGEVESPPAKRPLARYEARVMDGDVYVVVPTESD